MDNHKGLSYLKLYDLYFWDGLDLHVTGNHVYLDQLIRDQLQKQEKNEIEYLDILFLEMIYKNLQLLRKK